MSATIDGSNGFSVNGATVNPLTLGTAQATTSGTTFDFTGIPSWVNRITVNLNEVSTAGTTNIQLVLGTASGFETSGYVHQVAAIVTITPSTSNWTSGFVIGNVTGTNTGSGSVVITRVSGNTWVCSGVVKCSTTQLNYVAGSKTLSGALDRIRLNCTTGTDAFDAGSVNIMYE
jgi:hypothetical protein